MKTVNDTLGDALAVYRKKELDDVIAIGSVIVVQLQATGFDRLRHDLAAIDNETVEGGPKFDLDLPFTTTAGDLVHRFKGVVAYAGMSSISLVIEPSPKTEGHPSYFELAMEAASTASFHCGTHVAAMTGFTVADDPISPIRFHGDVFTFPDRELASRFIEWRQTLNHREVTIALGRRLGVHNDVVMKSLPQRREILEANGADFEGRLGDVLQGQLIRRQLIKRFPTERELSRMFRRPETLVQVPRAIFVPDARIPNLSVVGNLSSVLFDGADPEILDHPLARAVAC
jgi:hypothetical protein